MSTAIRRAMLCALLFLAACGYHNPYVYNGPEKIIYFAEWKNRTNNLELNTRLYQSLIRWFQKSGSLHIRAERQGADLILAGEIKSIYFPNLAYGANNVAATGRMYLTVRYILKDLRSGAVLLEEPNAVFDEEYLISTDVAITRSNEDEAIGRALEDLSQKIYQRCLAEIPKLAAKQTTKATGALAQ